MLFEYLQKQEQTVHKTVLKTKVDLHHSSSTVCPGRSGLFYIVCYYIKWVTTSWTHSILESMAKVDLNHSSSLSGCSFPLFSII